MNYSSEVMSWNETLLPISPFDYPQVAIFESLLEATVAAEEQVEPEVASAPQAGITPYELEQLLAVARAEASAETERALKKELEISLSLEAERVRGTVDRFMAERKQYFGRVEADVVRLALAIAAKILHREAQADPMLIAAMVRIALDKLQEGSTVTLRVPSAEIEKWRQCMQPLPHGISAEVVGDSQLCKDQCILQAELGSVDFSIDAQLKEVEQGFFDLLAQRPGL